MAERSIRRPLGVLVIVGVGIVGILAMLVLFSVPLGTGTPESSTYVVSGHPLLGKPAPEIDLETLDGERMTLSSLRGRPVLVNFWATWCIPCREEFGLLAAAYKEHAPDGLEILGIVHDDTADGARQFAADLGATWPMLFDGADVAWQNYLGVALPTSFFVDANGIVRAFSLGGFTESGLAAQLALILPAPEATRSTRSPTESPSAS